MNRPLTYKEAFNNACCVGFEKGKHEQISISAKWISENVSTSVAVEYLKAMEE